MTTRAGLVLLLTASLATAALAAAPDGAALYRRHCRSCHGADGRGDGVDAPYFSPRPTDLRSDVVRRYPTADLVARILDGRRLPLVYDPERLRQQANDVEDVTGFLVRLPRVDWPQAERGEELWIDRCETCHGPYGRPDVPPPAGTRRPPDLSTRAARERLDAADDLDELVRHGRHGMPALVPRVERDDAVALVAFVRLFSPGFEQYRRYCAPCHGDDGRPAGSFVEETPRPTVAFDRAWVDGVDPERLRLKVWHMAADKRPAMPHLRGELSSADATAIVTWLRRHR